MEVFKEFRFEAAHSLPLLPEGHKCRNVHGHSYRLRVCVRGPLDPQLGWVMDFAEIKRACKPLVDRVDHQFINDIEGLSNSTCENFAIWFWRHLKPRLPGLSRVELWETTSSGASYSGEFEGT